VGGGGGTAARTTHVCVESQRTSTWRAARRGAVPRGSARFGAVRRRRRRVAASAVSAVSQRRRAASGGPERAADERRRSFRKRRHAARDARGGARGSGQAGVASPGGVTRRIGVTATRAAQEAGNAAGRSGRHRTWAVSARRLHSRGSRSVLLSSSGWRDCRSASLSASTRHRVQVSQQATRPDARGGIGRGR
jgi:hypothetical protein